MASRRRLIGALLLGCLAAPFGLGYAPAAAADIPVTETALRIDGTPEPDPGRVRLDVSVLTTDAGTPKPAIVLAHGFGGTKADSLVTGQALARAGYTVITYTARGFAGSGGRIHLNAPDFEGADARRVIDLAASRPEVVKVGQDPVIGFAGVSYGGALSLLVAALDRRVDAIVAAYTWHSLTTALFPQYAVREQPSSLADVDSIEAAGVFKQRWASLFFLGGSGQEPDGAGSGRDGSSGNGGTRSPDGSGDGSRSANGGGDPNHGAERGERDGTGDSGDPLCGRFAANLCRGYLKTAQTGRPSADLLALLDRPGPEKLLPRITAPTLLIQGERDTLFPLDHADANLRGLPAGTPAKMIWARDGHDTAIDIDRSLPDLEAWFGRYLKKDGSAPDSTFTLAVPRTYLIGENRNRRPDILTATGYPGRDTDLQTQSQPLRGTAQRIVTPPGGAPAALTNLPGTGGALADVAGVGGYALGVLPGQSATFTTEPMTEPMTLLGSGSVDLSVTSSTSQATLFVSVWDLGQDTTASPGEPAVPQSAVLPGLAVAPVRLDGLEPGVERTVRVALPPVANRVQIGHRLQLVVSSTDQAYAGPAAAGSYRIDLGGARALVLPRVEATAVDATDLDVPLPLVIVVVGLLVAGLAGMLLIWLRRRSSHPREDLLDRPLVVQDLAKTYGDGFRAVDGVSFTAEAGQVVGLLGPNGAGKTTVLRMLVGLIRPDAGSVYVRGHAVHAGADVLGSVGAFIEGPGFLPHLSGWDNLQAYWQATGRPAEEAHLEEALRIAGLGSAIHRKVRGYSQGMRQRLGIAQAMLGLPSLLLLDEPTNGLDPPQIKAMRSVLADYAASGRTVVVSSHLLAEVEQTCTHVVVMHRGRVILTGAMADLTASDDVTLIGIGPGGDLTTSQRVLRSEGVATALERDVIRVSGDVPRARLVARLVEAGQPVESVDGRRQLEEVFLSLVGSPDREADTLKDAGRGAFGA
ncbi:MAG TPA: alpha/beta fold hydrolase [Propionibacteriaceae bacterium]|nr:alpha/beta fold hydrolase [Propionibacteriaceae bacterium]